MTYQEVINNIMSLGDSDVSEMEELMESGLLPDSINRAVTEINLDVPGAAPRNKVYSFSVDQEDTDTLFIDMESIDPKFMEFAETSMLYAKEDTDVFAKFNDFDVINESTVIINAENYAGDFQILYKAEHEYFTDTEENRNAQVPLARKVHHLVPLLAGYYVWLEDEPAKATQFFNLYGTKLADYEQKSQMGKVKVRVLPGGM